MNSPYVLDKSNAKFLGVCAGLANKTGVDATVIRVTAVLLTLFLFGPFSIAIYLLTALIARNG